MKTSPLAWSSLLVACALAAGCAGPTAATTPRGEPIVTAEYKQVYLTGSHIPVRVPTSPTARIPPTMSPLVILTPEEFGRGTSTPMH